jgi:hypothetical protein
MPSEKILESSGISECCTRRQGMSERRQPGEPNSPPKLVVCQPLPHINSLNLPQKCICEMKNNNQL